MRVLLAPEAFGSTLAATQAAVTLAEGWAASAPHDDLDLAPLSTGGAGFLDVIEGASGSGRTTYLAVTVSDPLGREVPAGVLLAPDGPGGAQTAYLEAAQAAGLHLLGADERRPTLTSSWGVGQLLLAALDARPGRIVLATGGTATNDGGAGLLAALGAGPVEVLGRGGLALADAPDDALRGLGHARALLRGTDLVVATESDVPLTGFGGTSAIDAPAKGASPADAQALESAIGRFTEVVARSGHEEVDLLTGAPRRLDRVPGAGAGGGLGYAALLLGGRLADAVVEAATLAGLRERVERADLVVTATGALDWRRLRGGGVAHVTTVAREFGRPVVVLAGESSVGRRETMAMGMSGVYAVAQRGDVGSALADPVSRVRELAARVARTWSPA